MKIDQLFEGMGITLSIPTLRLSPAQAEKVRKDMAKDPPQALRYKCVVADQLNHALNGGPQGTKAEDYGDFAVNGRVFRLNPKGRSQFYMSPAGEPCLTTSLVDVATGTRYSFTWRGWENTPMKLARVAVAHDLGETTKACTVVLSFDNAEKHIVGEKNGRKANDPRPNHDEGPNNKRRTQGDHRKTHRRICSKDLASR